MGSNNFMWVVFVTWVVLIFLYPLNSVNYWVKDLTKHTLATFLGIEGAAFLIFSGPILVIAFLCPFHTLSSLANSNSIIMEYEKKNSGKYGWSHRLSTFPVLVDGPFGVVSAAEVIGIICFVYALRDLTILDEAEVTTQTKISYMLQIAGLSVGVDRDILLGLLVCSNIKRVDSSKAHRCSFWTCCEISRMARTSHYDLLYSPWSSLHNCHGQWTAPSYKIYWSGQRVVWPNLLELLALQLVY
ncbi:hypothetical protein Ddye_028041 [Dipteronia dyeriana]|uniref:Uncharacterized protein n=1 Tax=Dipteronia dyeriana TaxID=168575 RepID=A0AAD9WR26_9ROSI|nr:hypothetical protein Ddye_028041 [Dipteronia dyeriana]